MKYFQEIFQKSPIIAYRWNKNWKQIVGSIEIEHNKRHNSEIEYHGRCSSCLSNSILLCCKAVISSSVFKSTQTNCEFNTFHRIDCKSAIIVKFNMSRKATDLSTFAKQTQKRLKKPKCHKRFILPGHIFNANVKFILIPTETLKGRLKNRENF